MRNNSGTLSDRPVAKRPGGPAATQPLRRWATWAAWVCGLALACAGLSGCESLQRKLTRKPKGPRAVPTPVINFQDYTQAMTPLDRYRKHYLIFDYWNGDFMDALQAKQPNMKRIKLASSESLNELTALQGLVTGDLAEQVTRLINVRAKLNKQVQTGHLSESAARDIWRELDAQSRTIRRDLFWRKVQDRLKPAQTPPPDEAPAAKAPPPSTQ